MANPNSSTLSQTAETNSAKASPGTILFLNRAGFLGGAERVVLVSMQQAADRGYRVILGCPEGVFPELARKMGFETIMCDFDRMKDTRNPLKLLSYAMKLRRESDHVVRICRDNNVTILNPHHPVSAMYGVKAAKSLGIPMIAYMHDAQPPKPAYVKVTRYIAGVGTHFLVASNAVRRRLDAMGIPSDRIQVLYYGIDPSFLGERPEPKPEIGGPGPNVGLFGQVMPWKGQDLFLEAAARLADRLPTAHFYIVGGLAYADDQPYLDRITAMANAPKLKGRVTFTGFQNEVPRWMMSMDVVVLSSTNDEALPMVPMEAMALGKRVVCTTVGGTVEIVTDNVTGRLVERDNPDALAEGIFDLATRPADDPIGERASASIHERFTPARFGNDIAEVYARANERRRAARA